MKGWNVLFVPARLSGSGQEETDGSHEIKEIVLVPSTVNSVRGLSATLAENGAESESGPPPLTEKPAEVRATGTIADVGDMTGAQRVQWGGNFGPPKEKGRVAPALS